MIIFRRYDEDKYLIEDIETDEVQKELVDWITNEYRDDKTFTKARVKETLDSITYGFYDAYLDGDIIHLEVEYGLGNLDRYITEVR